MTDQQTYYHFANLPGFTQQVSSKLKPLTLVNLIGPNRLLGRFLHALVAGNAGDYYFPFGKPICSTKMNSRFISINHILQYNFHRDCSELPHRYLISLQFSSNARRNDKHLTWCCEISSCLTNINGSRWEKWTVNDLFPLHLTSKASSTVPVFYPFFSQFITNAEISFE